MSQPGDDEPPEPRYVLNRNFALKPVGEELERLQAEDRERREEWEREQEGISKEGERVAKLKEEYEQSETISVAGFKVRLSDGVIVRR